MTLVIYVIPPASEVQKAKRQAKRRRTAINLIGAAALLFLILVLAGCQMPLR